MSRENICLLTASHPRPGEKRKGGRFTGCGPAAPPRKGRCRSGASSPGCRPVESTRPVPAEHWLTVELDSQDPILLLRWVTAGPPEAYAPLDSHVRRRGFHRRSPHIRLRPSPFTESRRRPRVEQAACSEGVGQGGEPAPSLPLLHQSWSREGGDALQESLCLPLDIFGLSESTWGFPARHPSPQQRGLSLPARNLCNDQSLPLKAAQCT